jgi:membrane-bound metal-dependent hydrolase YbcI (DUF457 family)
MIFFGHLGLTTAAFKTYEKFNEEEKNILKIDYRFVLVGSILPDLIDKPIGSYLFRSTFHNSRIFAHSLLFTFLLLVFGVLLLIKKRNNKVLTLGMATGAHLILDSMWLYKGILLWPYYGWKFPVRPEGNWAMNSLSRVVTDPTYFLAESIGFIILAYYFYRLKKNNEINMFVKKGKL